MKPEELTKQSQDNQSSRTAGNMMDKEVQFFGERVEQWVQVLKKSLQSEYQNTKLMFHEQEQKQIEEEKNSLHLIIQNLERQLQELTVTKNNCSMLITNRTKLIDNLLSASRSRERLNLVEKAFYRWKCRTHENRNSVISIKLARAWYFRSLSHKVLKGWYRLAETRRAQTLEHQVRQQCECRLAEISKQNSDLVNMVFCANKLRTEIQRLQEELSSTKNHQFKQQQELRIAFLRGVSALNTEAMGVFKKSSQQQAELVPRSVRDEIPFKPGEVRFENPGHGLTSTRGLVTRHYPSQ